MSSRNARERGRQPQARILVIEDDPGIAALVAYQLTRAGYRVETSAAGSWGLDTLHKDIPDLVVLDRMLPGLSGDDVLRAIRKDPATRSLPVVVLTAKREEIDRIEGLEMGADDYITKPFSPRELVLRVDAILRRARADGVSSPSGERLLVMGPLTVNLDARQATLEGKPIAVTPSEFRLLRALLQRRGRAVTRQRLLQETWETGPEVASRIRTRTVDMHIRRLRTKLGVVGNWIETVRGFGYRMRAPEPR